MFEIKKNIDVKKSCNVNENYQQLVLVLTIQMKLNKS